MAFQTKYVFLWQYQIYLVRNVLWRNLNYSSSTWSKILCSYDPLLFTSHGHSFRMRLNHFVKTTDRKVANCTMVIQQHYSVVPMHSVPLNWQSCRDSNRRIGNSRITTLAVALLFSTLSVIFASTFLRVIGVGFGVFHIRSSAFGIWNLVLFLPFHASILEPDFDLSLW